jgi:hypothetical protein
MYLRRADITESLYIPFLPYSRNVDVCIERAVLDYIPRETWSDFLKYFFAVDIQWIICNDVISINTFLSA